MNFKTWIKDINKAALALDQLNKINFDASKLSVTDIKKISGVDDITAVFSELQSISKADYGDFGAFRIQESAIAISSLNIGNIADADAIVTIMNGLNGLLSVLNSVTDVLGSWGTIGVGAGLFGIYKNVDYLKTPVCPHHI